MWCHNPACKRGTSPKQARPWKSPFRVVRSCGHDNYVITSPKGGRCNRVHHNRLKPRYQAGAEQPLEQSPDDLETSSEPKSKTEEHIQIHQRAESVELHLPAPARNYEDSSTTNEGGGEHDIRLAGPDEGHLENGQPRHPRAPVWMNDYILDT